MKWISIRVAGMACALLGWGLAAAAGLSVDLDGDGKADLLWSNAATGQSSYWTMSGSRPTGSALLLTHPDWRIVAAADLNGDGKSDLIWHNASTGQTSYWLMSGGALLSSGLLLTDPHWRVVGTGDLNGDGNTDLLWYNATTGQTAYWLMNGAAVIGSGVLLTDPNWTIAAVADLNGDGRADLVWHNPTTGQSSYWLMSGASAVSAGVLLTDANWVVAAAGDLDGDGKADLLWYNATTGQSSYWLMAGGAPRSSGVLLTDANWRIVLTGDLDGDGKSDLLWYNPATGQTSTWTMNGAVATGAAVLLSDPNWRLAFGGSRAAPWSSYASNSAELGAWSLLTQERSNCSFGSLEQDARLDLATKAHADYLAKSSVQAGALVAGHFEDASSPFFYGASPGDRAVRAGFSDGVGEILTVNGALYTTAVPAPTSATGAAAMLGLLETIYHLRLAVDARLRSGSVGGSSQSGPYASAPSFTLGAFALVSDLGLGAARRLGAGNVNTWPCAGTTSPSGTWYPATESPSPFPEITSTSVAYGTPVYFAADAGSSLIVTSAVLARASDSVAVPSRNITQTTDSSIGSNEFFLVPTVALQRGTPYRVRASGTAGGVPFQKDFKFSTRN